MEHSDVELNSLLSNPTGSSTLVRWAITLGLHYFFLESRRRHACHFIKKMNKKYKGTKVRNPLLGTPNGV
jgi:hypothetical protein